MKALINKPILMKVNQYGTQDLLLTHKLVNFGSAREHKFHT